MDALASSHLSAGSVGNPGIVADEAEERKNGKCKGLVENASNKTFIPFTLLKKVVCFSL